MNISTLYQLSSVLLEKLDGVTPTQLLSALNCLSGMPIHPYEQIKYSLFDKDYKFPTIDDIEVPANFNFETSMQELSCKHKELVSLMLAETSAISLIPEKETNIFNKDIVKKNILNAELASSITLNDINTRPVEVAQKIITFYLQN